MSERIIVMFAYHFPPENAVGGRRPFRFSRYLPEMGYRCHVITAADQSSRPDSDAEYVPDPFESGPRRGLGWQLERAIRRFLLPGVSGIQWGRLACQAAWRFVRANADAEITIFSTFPPVGTHFAAWQFSRSSGLKWIADYRDPLAFSPWVKGFSPFHRALSRWIERVFLRSADVVIANTDAMAEAWKSEYPAIKNRIHVMWNGFDPEERLEPLPLPPRDYRLYSHTGELYAGRDITPLLESIARLIDAGRISRSRIKIRLVGSVDRHSMPPEVFVQRAQGEGWLEIFPHHVAQTEAQHLMQTSDGLLLVQPQSAIQVPSKLFDYIQMGRPVLAYVPPDSPIERVLRQSGIPYRCAFVTSSQPEFDRAVESYFSLETGYSPAGAWFYENFDARKQSRTLADLAGSLSVER